MNPIDEKIRNVLTKFSCASIRFVEDKLNKKSCAKRKEIINKEFDQALLAIKQVFLEMVGEVKCDERFSGHYKDGYDAAKAELWQKVG